MSDISTDTSIDVGSDQGRGNLVGVQPCVVAEDYASETAFRARMAGYLEAAERAGWLNPRSVVVFPEYTGTWLVAADEAPSVYHAASSAQAMRTLALRRPFAFLKTWLSSAENDRLTASLFRLKAAPAAGIYQRVFGGLARQFGVSIVAGSILLPEPGVQDGVVTPGSGRLYNVSAVFQPDGRAHPRLVRKAFPISSEQPFISAGRVEDLPVFDTPAGRLGVLVCADSWFPAAYLAIQPARVDMIAVPSYISSNDAWDQPWQGYNGAQAPVGCRPGGRANPQRGPGLAKVRARRADWPGRCTVRGQRISARKSMGPGLQQRAIGGGGRQPGL